MILANGSYPRLVVQEDNMVQNNYKPISDYGAIGNMRSVALVGRDGSIDWCCFPYLDQPSVFAAILDSKKGGCFRVGMNGMKAGEQEYIKDSNVLRTTIQDGERQLIITDYFPLEGDINGAGNSSAHPEIHRLIECRGQEAEVSVEWSPRFDYARASTQISSIHGGWLAKGGKYRMSLAGIEDVEVRDEGYGPVVRGKFKMRSGERRLLITRWGTDFTGCEIEGSLETMKQTARIWHDWAHMADAMHSDEWAGDLIPQVIRSELVFKMLIHADTGAVAAAPTTSLPETIGGVRNWDYRYAWIRDASLTAQALIALGHSSEAVELLHWMEKVSAAQYDDAWELQIMYGLKGEPDLDEYELSHMEGYCSSTPVRIGNGAAKQFQLETYGEILNTAYELMRRGQKLHPRIMSFLRHVADHVTGVWQRPDYGIWEVRGGPQHFTYSKVMAWVALDRAVQLANRYGLSGDIENWSRNRDEIKEQVLRDGYNREVGAFTIYYGSTDMDAANLRIPLMEFLPPDDPRVQGTINRTIEQLTENDLVYRYIADDGLPGKEGAFGLCSFWLVDVLALSKRLDEARKYFSRITELANHIGLYPEQFEPGSGKFLGNFPQAFTHIGLINSALYMAYAEGKEIPEHAPIGTPEHRDGQ